MTDPNIIANAQPGSWWIDTTEPSEPLVFVRTDQGPHDPEHWRVLNGTTGGDYDWRNDEEAAHGNLMPLIAQSLEADSNDVALLNLTADMLEAVGIAEDTDYDAVIARLRARAARLSRDPDEELAETIATQWFLQWTEGGDLNSPDMEWTKRGYVDIALTTIRAMRKADA